MLPGFKLADISETKTLQKYLVLWVVCDLQGLYYVNMVLYRQSSRAWPFS